MSAKTTAIVLGDFNLYYEDMRPTKTVSRIR